MVSPTQGHCTHPPFYASQANPPQPPPIHPIKNGTIHSNNLFPRLNRQLPPNPPSRKPNLLLLIHRHPGIIQIQQMRIHPLRPRILRYLLCFLDSLRSRFCMGTCICAFCTRDSCCCVGRQPPAEKFSESIMQRCCACRAEIASWVFAEEGAVGRAGLRGHWHFECSFLVFFGLFWGGWVV